ncbi:MAG: hypothetical protein HYX89_06255 [Chloroflexi bacterium]|nr:hypothetical protein [Chloroflexota bacterium]
MARDQEGKPETIGDLEEFRQHLRLALRELLLAVEAFVDAGLKELEVEEEAPSPAPTPSSAHPRAPRRRRHAE